MRLIAKHFGRAFSFFLLLSGIFWLPKDFEDYSTAAEPWKRAYSALDQNTALWIFSTVLFVWIFATDVRRFLEEQRSKLAARPKPETSADIFLKERLIEFGKNYYVPATDAQNEALRLSAYVVKDSWDHPAKLFVFMAFSRITTYDAKYRTLFGGSVNIANLSRTNLEAALVAALTEYGVRSHWLQHVVTLLYEENKPLDLHGFKSQLTKFWHARQAMIAVLKDVQTLPGLSDIKNYDISTYIDDKEKWNMSVIEKALNPEPV
ncbi:hypothetical protein [Rhizobium sp. Leaf386]|uniref:hypothetical protein n=1 Tax=Rhizobium sp. Leaf386 TaxID=1736359 RepID=UPI000715AB70|nr:hypothetical protein [Rhizobium sp. Leaf386]KQS89818.1 hypothetical protein ASG50_27915 [Rhizobium sp. Leaf386]